MKILLVFAKKAGPWALRAYLVYSIILDVVVVSGIVYYFFFR